MPAKRRSSTPPLAPRTIAAQPMETLSVARKGSDTKRSSERIPLPSVELKVGLAEPTGVAPDLGRKSEQHPAPANHSRGEVLESRSPELPRQALQRKRIHAGARQSSAVPQSVGKPSIGFRLPLIPNDMTNLRTSLRTPEVHSTMNGESGELQNRHPEHIRNDAARAAIRFFAAYPVEGASRTIKRAIGDAEVRNSALRPLMYVRGGFAEPVSAVPARPGWRVLVNPYSDIPSDRRGLQSPSPQEIGSGSLESVTSQSKEPSTTAVSVELRTSDQPSEAAACITKPAEEPSAETREQIPFRESDPLQDHEPPAEDRQRVLSMESDPIEKQDRSTENRQRVLSLESEPIQKQGPRGEKTDPTPVIKTHMEQPVIKVAARHHAAPIDGRILAAIPQVEGNPKRAVRSVKLDASEVRSESVSRNSEAPTDKTPASKYEPAMSEDAPERTDQVAASQPHISKKPGVLHDNVRHAMTNPPQAISAQPMRTLQGLPPSTARWDNLVQFVEKIMRNAAITHRSDGLSELRVRMTSESLGKVSIQLSVMDDQVNVQFAADSTQARQVLNAHREELAQILKDSGASTATIDVSTSSSGGFERYLESEGTGDHSESYDPTGYDGTGSASVLELIGEADVSRNYAARELYLGDHSSMVWVA